MTIPTSLQYHFTYGGRERHRDREREREREREKHLTESDNETTTERDKKRQREREKEREREKFKRESETPAAGEKRARSAAAQEERAISHGRSKATTHYTCIHPHRSPTSDSPARNTSTSASQRATNEIPRMALPTAHSISTTALEHPIQRPVILQHPLHNAQPTK